MTVVVWIGVGGGACGAAFAAMACLCLMVFLIVVLVLVASTLVLAMSFFACGKSNMSNAMMAGSRTVMDMMSVNLFCFCSSCVSAK